MQISLLTQAAAQEEINMAEAEAEQVDMSIQQLKH
jgi:hypothetical protein